MVVVNVVVVNVVVVNVSEMLPLVPLNPTLLFQTSFLLVCLFFVTTFRIQTSDLLSGKRERRPLCYAFILTCVDR